MKVNVLSRLKHRIYLDDKGQIRPPDTDFDNWRQCWHCGEIVPIYEVAKESAITPVVQATDNPFNKGKVAIRGIESRKFGRTGKTYHIRKRKQKTDLSNIKEEDLKQALRKGAKLISYSSTGEP